MQEEEIDKQQDVAMNEQPGEENVDKEAITNADPENEMVLLRKNCEEINDKYLRLYSEFDNFRKRTQKEKLELYKTAGEDILASLLPIVDDLERAHKAVTENGDTEAYQKGVDLIRQKLNNTLGLKGLRQMESSSGKDFDINFHEAITRVAVPESNMKGKVIDEVEKGYLLYDKVIRYAKVVVGE